MPLSMLEQGREVVIQRVGGREDTRLFLEKLGFVTGCSVRVISEADGNLIVDVKGSRVAIGKEMAGKVIAA